MADAAVLGAKVLLAGTEAADHAVGVLEGMRRGAGRSTGFVVAAVACVHTHAAAEAEPAVGTRVVPAATALGQLGASNEAEHEGRVGLASGAGGVGRVGGVGDAEELEVG